jgi:hypothetical protein
MFFFTALHDFIVGVIMLIIKTIIFVMLAGSGVAVFQERKLWAHDTTLGWVGYLKIYLYPMTTMAGTLLGVIAMAPAWIMDHKKGKFFFQLSSLERERERERESSLVCERPWWCE